MGVTVLLVGLALYYAFYAVKGHVNTANTLEALFTGVDRIYLKNFTIRRPDILYTESVKSQKEGIVGMRGKASRSLTFL